MGPDNKTKLDAAQQSQCLGKFPFRSSADASKACKRDKGLMPYRCSFCGWWHIGHAAPASVRERWRANKKRWKK